MKEALPGVCYSGFRRGQSPVNGVFPTKGLTLPLVSYGGSSIVVTLCALALLLRVDYENRLLMRGKRRR